MTNTAPITLEACFRYWRALPHQLAAISELEADLKANGYDSAMRRDRPWFATWSQAGKQSDEAWLAPAAKIIKEFEGLRLAAYKDAVGVLTIGWGHTGPDVTPNLRITQEHAEELLAADMREAAAGVLRALPSWSNWQANEQAAMVSFVFNIGGGAFASSTLVKRIQAGEARRTVIPQELPRWNKGDGKALPGLTRRREAEVALFMGTPQLELPAQQPAQITPQSPFSARLTAHIRLGEFALDQEARRFRHQYQVDTAAELAAFLERVRRNFGGKPIIITSGYRPPEINSAVGGASRSEHLYDKPGVGAVDFYVDGADIFEVQAFCERYWPYSTGLGAPKGFVHCGIREGRPRVAWVY